MRSLVRKHKLSLADTSSMRVRAEVDGRDLRHIRAGQQAIIQSDALDGSTLMGKVSRIGSQMGRKKVRIGDPAEKAIAMCMKC